MKRIIYSSMFLILFVSNLNAQLSHLVVSLTGKVMDEKTYQPIGIKYNVIDNEGKVFARGQSNAKDGYYFITGLIPNSSYSIQFDDFDYFRQDYPFDIPNTDKYNEFSKDFLIKPKKEGVSLPFRVPPFELNKSKIRFGADMFLKNTLMTLKSNRKMTFKICCFPDNNLNPSANLAITKARALSLKDYFISNGIAADRIVDIISESKTDPDLPPPISKRAKGKRYIGTTYIIVNSF